jgi:hypothetical protein
MDHQRSLPAVYADNVAGAELARQRGRVAELERANAQLRDFISRIADAADVPSPDAGSTAEQWAEYQSIVGLRLLAIKSAAHHAVQTPESTGWHAADLANRAAEKLPYTPHPALADKPAAADVDEEVGE